MKLKLSKGRIIYLSILGVLFITYVVFLILGTYLNWDNFYYISINIFMKVNSTSYLSDPVYYILRIICAYIFVISVGNFLRLLCSLLLKLFKKGKAIINLLSSFIKYISAIILIFLILSICGVDTTTLLAGAGILSLIVGLGAQPLIEDIIAGLFIVFEDVFDVGDIINIDDFRGTVKEMGIRTTKIEDAGGDIKVVNNSDIRSLINMTSELSLAICDIDIDYNESLENVEKIINNNLAKIKENNPKIISGPYYLGVQNLGQSGVTLRFTANCKEIFKYQVQRDLNRDIKILFDKNNITIPFAQVVVHEATKKE